MLEDDGALGFGGVGGEDQLDAHPRQRRGDLIGREAAVHELLQTLAPQRLHRRQPVLGFRLPLLLDRRILLDHAEQVERDRVRLRQPLGRNRLGLPTAAVPSQGS